nr:Asp23/Gls24 family envelope stress response protein [Rathayibacter iranicus]
MAQYGGGARARGAARSPRGSAGWSVGRARRGCHPYRADRRGGRRGRADRAGPDRRVVLTDQPCTPRRCSRARVIENRGGAAATESRVAVAAAASAERVPGVHHLGGAMAREFDRAARHVLGTSTRPGVTVAATADDITVDIDLVVEYPHPVRDVLDAVREQVQRVAEPVAGTCVIVNVAATDIHGPFDTVESARDSAG